MLISTDVPALVAIVPRIACLMICHRCVHANVSAASNNTP